MTTRYDSDLELINAADEGDLDRAAELLGRGADPNWRDVMHGGTPLQIAAAGGHLELVKLLVQNGADVNLIAGDVPITALESAAIAGRVDVLDWLLQIGARLPNKAKCDELILDAANAGDHDVAALLEAACKRR